MRLLWQKNDFFNFSICRKRSVFPGPKMCSSADRRAVCGQDCRRGQVHLQPWPQPRRPQKRGHHMSHVETSAHSGALGDLQLRGKFHTVKSRSVDCTELCQANLKNVLKIVWKVLWMRNLETNWILKLSFEIN